MKHREPFNGSAGEKDDVARTLGQFGIGGPGGGSISFCSGIALVAGVEGGKRKVPNLGRHVISQFCLKVN